MQLEYLSSFLINALSYLILNCMSKDCNMCRNLNEVRIHTGMVAHARRDKVKSSKLCEDDRTC